MQSYAIPITHITLAYYVLLKTVMNEQNLAYQKVKPDQK